MPHFGSPPRKKWPGWRSRRSSWNASILTPGRVCARVWRKCSRSPARFAVVAVRLPEFDRCHRESARWGAAAHAKNPPLARREHRVALGRRGLPDDGQEFSEHSGLPQPMDAPSRAQSEHGTKSRDFDRAGGVRCFTPRLTSNGISDTFYARTHICRN